MPDISKFSGFSFRNLKQNLNVKKAQDTSSTKESKGVPNGASDGAGKTLSSTSSLSKGNNLKTTSVTTNSNSNTVNTPVYSLSELQTTYGFSNEVIAKYFDCIVYNGEQAYTLKPDCGFENALELKSYLETTESVNNDKHEDRVGDSDKQPDSTYTLQDLKNNYGFSDDIIAQYFDYSEDNGQREYTLKPDCGFENALELKSYLETINSSSNDKHEDRVGDSDKQPGIAISDILNPEYESPVDLTNVKNLLNDVFEKYGCTTPEEKEKFAGALIRLLNAQCGVQESGELSLDAAEALKDASVLNNVKNIISNDVTLRILSACDGKIGEIKLEQNAAFFASGLMSLANSKVGSQAIADAIKVNADGTITVTFKGVIPSDENRSNSVTYSVEELQNILIGKKKDGSVDKPWTSGGDMDVKLLELAYRELIYNNPDASNVKKYSYAIWEVLTGDNDTIANFDINKNMEDTQAWLERLLSWEKSGNDYAASVYIHCTGNNNVQFVDKDGNEFTYKTSDGNRPLSIINVEDGFVTFYDSWLRQEITTSWETFKQLDIYIALDNCFERNHTKEEFALDPNIPTINMEAVDYTDVTIRGKHYQYFKQDTLLSYCNDINSVSDPSMKQLAELLNSVFAQNGYTTDTEKMKFINTFFELIQKRAGVSENLITQQGLTPTVLENINQAGGFEVLKQIAESPAAWCRMELYQNYGLSSYNVADDFANLKQGPAGSWILNGLYSIANSKFGNMLSSAIKWSDDCSKVNVTFPGLNKTIELDAQYLMDLYNDKTHAIGSSTAFILEVAYLELQKTDPEMQRKDGESLHEGYTHEIYQAFLGRDTLRGIVDQDGTTGEDESKIAISVDDNVVDDVDIQNWLQKLLNYQKLIREDNERNATTDYVATFGINWVNTEPLIIKTLDGREIEYTSNMTRGITIKDIDNGRITIWDSWHGEYSVTWNQFIDTFGEKIYSLRDAVAYGMATETVQTEEYSEWMYYKNVTSLNLGDFPEGAGNLDINTIVQLCNDEKAKGDGTKQDSFGRFTSLLNLAFERYGCTTDEAKQDLVGGILKLLCEQYGIDFQGTLTPEIINKLNEEVLNVINDKGDTIVQKNFFDKLSDVINGNYFYTMNWLQNISDTKQPGQDYDIKVTAFKMDEPGITLEDGTNFCPTGKVEITIKDVVVDENGNKYVIFTGEDPNVELKTSWEEFCRLNIYTYEYSLRTHEGAQDYSEDGKNNSQDGIH